MKHKIPSLLNLFRLILMVSLLFSSCEKDLYIQPTDTSFSAENAKEWYYSNLKKSEKFKVSSKTNWNKLPDWKNGAYRKVGNFEIIEFPLIKDKKEFLIEKNITLSDFERKRILDASLCRVVFIKEGQNEIELRELNYISDYKYLEQKGFDISGVDLSKERNDFSGTLLVKTWDSQKLSKKILANGKIIKTFDYKKNKINKNQSTNRTSACVTIVNQLWIVSCEIERIGDE